MIIEVNYGILTIQNMLTNIQILQAHNQLIMETQINMEMQYMKLLVLAVAILVVGTLVSLTFLFLATQCSYVGDMLTMLAMQVCLLSATMQVLLILTTVFVQSCLVPNHNFVT